MTLYFNSPVIDSDGTLKLLSDFGGRQPIPKKYKLVIPKAEGFLLNKYKFNANGTPYLVFDNTRAVLGGVGFYLPAEYGKEYRVSIHSNSGKLLRFGYIEFTESAFIKMGTGANIVKDNDFYDTGWKELVDEEFIITSHSDDVLGVWLNISYVDGTALSVTDLENIIYEEV